MKHPEIKFDFDDVSREDELEIKTRVNASYHYLLNLCAESLEEFFEDWNDVPATPEELKKFHTSLFISRVTVNSDDKGKVYTIYVDLGEYFGGHYAEGIAMEDDFSDIEFSLAG